MYNNVDGDQKFNLYMRNIARHGGFQNYCLIAMYLSERSNYYDYNLLILLSLSRDSLQEQVGGKKDETMLKSPSHWKSIFTLALSMVYARCNADARVQ